MSDEITYRGPVNSTHGGGTIVAGPAHNVLVSVNGALREVSVLGDSFCCPICPTHCCNPVKPTGFATVEGLPIMRKEDSSACGATNFTPCDNTFSTSTNVVPEVDYSDPPGGTPP